jgi:hypothetical protein
MQVPHRDTHMTVLMVVPMAFVVRMRFSSIY